jgi:hypothetical protein
VCAGGFSALVGASGSTLGFGFVLQQDPRTTNQQAPFESTAYSVAIAVDGQQVATVGSTARRRATATRSTRSAPAPAP